MPNPQLSHSLRKLIAGVRKFQNEVYPQRQALFKALAKDQKPKILFITCSDSRVDTSLITQTDPGDMFIIKNAGNLIPPYGAAPGGTSASIDYAVSILEVEHIIVCGHSDCGAMAALFEEDALADKPLIRQWLAFAETALSLSRTEKFQGLNEEERLKRCIEANVIAQLTHLKTIPSVVSGLATGKLRLHGWVYDIESGAVNVYSEQKKHFISILDDAAVNMVLNSNDHPESSNHCPTFVGRISNSTIIPSVLWP